MKCFRLAALVAIAAGAFAQRVDLGAAAAADFQRQSQAVSSPAVDAYLGRVTAAVRMDAGLLQLRAFTGGTCGDDKPVWFTGGFVFVPVHLFLASANEEQFLKTLAKPVWMSQHPTTHSGGGGTIPVTLLGGCDALLPLAFQPKEPIPALEPVSAELFATAQAEVRAGVPPRKVPTLFRQTEPKR